jgi:hypothetical protein
VPDQIQSARVLSQGGINTNENSLILSTEKPGCALRLVNYETSLSGGYRRIEGYRYLDADFTGPAGEGKILGVTSFLNTSDNLIYHIAARKEVGVNTYRFYYLDPFGTGWTVTGPAGRSTVDPNGDNIVRVRFAHFNFGTVNYVIAVDGCNNAVVWDGTTWSTLDPGNAGTEPAPGGDQLLEFPSVVDVFADTIFVSGDVTAPAVVSHSVAREWFDWTAAGGGGQLIFSQDVVQIFPWRNFLYIFGNTHIHKAYPDVSAGFLQDDVTTDLGCIARDSIQEIGGNIVFMSQDGIRPIAGTDRVDDIELTLLSQNIQGVIDDVITNHDMADLCSLVVRSKTQFRYFFDNSTTDRENAQGLIGSLRVKDDAYNWEFGELLGIRASCTSSRVIQGNEYVLHGDYDGIVYRQEMNDSTFQGEDILSIYTTPFLDFGDTEIRKLLRTINIFMAAEGEVDIDISLRFDWDDPDSNIVLPAVYPVNTAGSPVDYDDGTLYDSGAVYGGDSKPRIKQNIQGSCFSVQFTFASQGDYLPHTIHGFVTEISVQGRE